jgi:DNA invertase Pin-like site-specific DNA recombinase
MPTEKVGRAFGYLRVSTSQQSESGLGIEAQKTAVSAAAQRLGLPLVNVFTDAGTSGSLAIEDRPVLLEAVSALKRHDWAVMLLRLHSSSAWGRSAAHGASAQPVKAVIQTIPPMFFFDGSSMPSASTSAF